MPTYGQGIVMTLPLVPAASTRPIRILLGAASGRRARGRLASSLGAYGDRVEVLPRRHRRRPDLVLVDPCAGGRSLDLSRLDELAGDDPCLVVYTAAPCVDPLAFAMAGSVLDGRLRGWLSSELSPDLLLDALERIQSGEIVVESSVT